MHRKSMANHLCPSSHSLHPKQPSSTINRQFAMPSISIVVLVVVIAAIGQQQIQFVNADAQLPYAGSLYSCGETNSATDKAGTPWTYEFKCKDGDQCVSGTCMNCPNKMDKQEDAAYCTIARSQVKRCKEGFCVENYDLSRHCGFAFKRAVDGQTYYMNCEGGYDCSDGLCTDGSKPIITRCNKDFDKDRKVWANFKFTCSAAEGQKEFWQPKLLPSTFGAAKTRGIFSIGYVVPFPYKCPLPKKNAFYCWNTNDYILILHKDDIKPNELSKVTKCFDVPYPNDPIPPTTPTTTSSTTTLETTTTPTTQTTMSTTPMTTKRTKVPGMRTQWHFGTRKWKMGGFLDKITPFPPGARVIMEDGNSDE